MYRLQVEDSQGNMIGYQNVDSLTEAEFVSICVGARPQTQPSNDWPPANTVYSAAWDPEHNQWLAGISAEEAIQHYPHCERPMFP